MKYIFVGIIVSVFISVAQTKATEALSINDAKIARVWHGKVANKDAVTYETIISKAVKGFLKIKGNCGYILAKEERDGVTHFMVTSYWLSKNSIEAYAGKDIRKVHSLPEDAQFLLDPEPTVMNYEFVAKETSAK